MSWEQVLSATGTVVAIALGLDGNIRSRQATKRERRAADLNVMIREFSNSGSEWATAKQQLVISNTGPGDAKEVEIMGLFPNIGPEEACPFLSGPTDRTHAVQAGTKLRIDCHVVEEMGNDWEPSDVPFPIDLVISWVDGTGPQQRTITLNSPED